MHLYVHVPFCARRCSYCDFAIAVRRDAPVQEFVDAIARELQLRDLGGTALETLYFGGGTPSKLGGAGVAQLVDAVGARFAIAANAEVTIEANPEDVTAGSAVAWHNAGVNRVSLGAQSFDQAVLAWMHRTHTADETRRAVRTLRDTGIANISMDLIFALPESLSRDWDRDIGETLSLEPGHISVYGLTVERATPLGRWTARGDVKEAPEERWASEFTRAHDQLCAAGFAHYEVSNYARSGRRAEHNQAYWKDRAYIGVGPSAHGFDGATRRWNESAYAHWLARVTGGEDPVAGSEMLTAEQRYAERVYIGLRTDAGFPLEPSAVPVVKPWVDSGWAVTTETDGQLVLHLTPTGWMRLDALAGALTSLGSRY
jgi:oxygen-independent coproporphyrinogen-3 oxidase